MNDVTFSSNLTENFGSEMRTLNKMLGRIICNLIEKLITVEYSEKKKIVYKKSFKPSLMLTVRSMKAKYFLLGKG